MHDHPHSEPHDVALGPDALNISVEGLTETSMVRLPDPAGPDWERAMADANAAAAAASSRRLRDHFPELDEVLAATAGSRPGPVTAASATTTLGLDRLFDRLMVTADVQPGRLRVTAADGSEELGDALHPSSPGYGFTTVDHGTIATRLAEGGSITVLCAEEREPRLRAHLEDWDRLLGASARADAVIVGRDARRIWQPDDAVRLVVPVVGRGVVRAADGEVEIGVGHAAFAAPGNTTTVEAVDGSIEAVVLVLPRITLRHLVGLATSEALYWPILRGDLPHDRTPELVESFAGSVFDRPDGFATALDDALDDAALARVVARARAGLPGRYRSTLSRSIEMLGVDHDRFAVRVPLPGGLYPVDSTDTPSGSVLVAIGGKQFRLPVDAARLLALIADGHPHELADLVTTFDGSLPVADLVRGLVAASIVEVA